MAVVYVMFKADGTPVRAQSGPSAPSAIHDILQFGDRSVRPAPDLATIAADIRRSHRGRATMILIGPTQRPGWREGTLTAAKQPHRIGHALHHLVQSKPGSTQAILIGLLLPAVQKVREGARSRMPLPELASLKSALMPDGTVQVVGDFGELTPCV